MKQSVHSTAIRGTGRDSEGATPRAAQAIPTPSIGTPELEAYLTAQNVAALLQVSVKTIVRMVESDPSMPVLKLGPRLMRFPKAKLLKWLASREQGAGRARPSHKLTPSISKPLDRQGMGGVVSATCANSWDGNAEKGTEKWKESV